MDSKKTCVSALILALTLAGVATSGTDGRFSLRSLKGTYGFNGAGTLAAGTVQAGIVGLNSFDGKGGCSIRVRLNAGGTVFPLDDVECSYTVNSDGTGQIVVRFDHPVFAGPFISDFVIVDNGREVPFSVSDVTNTTVATGVSRKQSSDRD